MTRRNGPLAALVVAGLVIPLASGCGGTAGQRPAAIGARAACRLLRADAAGRSGHRPDNRTLRLIADHVTAPRLAADARTAIQDLDHGSSPDIAFALLHAACARAGITIWPPPASGS
ncbi:MAG: hypothetical protein ACYCVZ_08885 [Streptosporangiaceae bacterium]